VDGLSRLLTWILANVGGRRLSRSKRLAGDPIAMADWTDLGRFR